jgi:hypothetical protein
MGTDIGGLQLAIEKMEEVLSEKEAEIKQIHRHLTSLKEAADFLQNRSSVSAPRRRISGTSQPRSETGQFLSPKSVSPRVGRGDLAGKSLAECAQQILEDATDEEREAGLRPDELARRALLRGYSSSSSRNRGNDPGKIARSIRVMLPKMTRFFTIEEGRIRLATEE